MTLENGNVFRATGLCEGNPPVTGGFPSQKASNADLWCFLWSAPEMFEQSFETPVIWDAITLIKIEPFCDLARIKITSMEHGSIKFLRQGNYLRKLQKLGLLYI